MDLEQLVQLLVLVEVLGKFGSPPAPSMGAAPGAAAPPQALVPPPAPATARPNPPAVPDGRRQSPGRRSVDGWRVALTPLLGPLAWV